MALSVIVYVTVSLLTSRGRSFDMDRMLHRGAYAIKEENVIVSALPEKGWRVLGMGREFTPFDKVIYVATYVWTLSWVAVFTVGTVLNLTGTVGSEAWLGFWKAYVLIYLAVSIVVIVWFSAGGFINLRGMIRQLRTMTRDHSDSGYIERK
jgi:SSS family solute:Na+ symporter